MNLKFRAWDLEYEKMVGVDIINLEDGKLDFIGDGITYFRKAKDIELMQSTGLTDINGKEIFEGDILKVTDEHSWLEVEYSWLEVVSFNEHKGMFVSKEIHRNTDSLESPLWNLFISDLLQIEIIGNMWEDGELLDVENTEEN